MISRLLIANRGEIAVRVARTAREMGIETIGVRAESETGAFHALRMDRVVSLGAGPPSETYLSIPRLLDAARAGGADAVHPGYGFLSENADFARAVEAAGLTWVGPPAAAIEAMGDKQRSRAAMEKAGVPVVPGSRKDAVSDGALGEEAKRLGLPLMIKASAGGGGKGMSRVDRFEDLPAALAEGRRLAAAAFADDTVYLERLLEGCRHVEFQVFGDTHGGVAHLFERECSVQRRHQKIVEETPSPALDADRRRAMGEAAVAAARAVGYVGAGTVEFLVDAGGRFYFLEMNTRLQVEHPVTEQVTGVDLVRAQIGVAAGRELPWTQTDLSQRGHAIELRIYAEDPARQDLPQAGALLLYREPSMPGIRIDSGVTEGSEVSVHYDPLLVKLIASGETRDTARARALAAIRNYPILGIRTNIPLLIELLEHPKFVSGNIDTGFLDAEGDAIRARLSSSPSPAVMAVAAAARAAGTTAAARSGAARVDDIDPWSSLRGARV
jgi:3-methylcrotonyl-CoA carboxylase alpha subunit